MMEASNILLGYCLVCGDPMAQSVACLSHVQRSCPAAAVQVQASGPTCGTAAPPLSHCTSCHFSELSCIGALYVSYKTVRISNFCVICQVLCV